MIDYLQHWIVVCIKPKLNDAFNIAGGLKMKVRTALGRSKANCPHPLAL